MLKEEFNFSNTQYGLFVSFYSIANTLLLMAVIGGIILDKFGIKKTGFAKKNLLKNQINFRIKIFLGYSIIGHIYLLH